MYLLNLRVTFFRFIIQEQRLKKNIPDTFIFAKYGL